MFVGNLDEMERQIRDKLGKHKCCDHLPNPRAVSPLDIHSCSCGKVWVRSANYERWRQPYWSEKRTIKRHGRLVAPETEGKSA